MSTFDSHLDRSALARIHFIIRTTRGAVPAVDTSVPREAACRGRTELDGPTPGKQRRLWAMRNLVSCCVACSRSRLPIRRGQTVAQAVADLRRIEKVLGVSPLEVSLHPPADGGLPGLRLYRAKEPVALSDVLPIIGNLGLRVVAEEPFRIDCADGPSVWIHEFSSPASPS